MAFSKDIRTKSGYDLYEVASALQKTIRRNKPDLAGFFALELHHSGYTKYVWKRLLTISAEDCHGIITQEVEALFNSYEFVNRGVTRGTPPNGRIFLTKAVLILCAHAKSRDSDHLQNLIYDKKALSDQELENFLGILDTQEVPPPIPDYAYDVHTRRGKRMGKTKNQFFKEEQEGLEPKQPGLFDHLVESKSVVK